MISADTAAALLLFLIVALVTGLTVVAVFVFALRAALEAEWRELSNVHQAAQARLAQLAEEEPRAAATTGTPEPSRGTVQSPTTPAQDVEGTPIPSSIRRNPRSCNFCDRFSAFFHGAVKRGRSHLTFF